MAGIIGALSANIKKNLDNIFNSIFISSGPDLTDGLVGLWRLQFPSDVL